MFDVHALTIISGGQTGADRAALDFAIDQGLSHGGWCPRGRLAEDGPIASRYELRETPSRGYAQRTEWNVRDSDATVAFSISRSVRGGTRLTLELARRLGKPSLHVSLDECAAKEAAEKLRNFLVKQDVRRLNIAGPRESQAPSIGAFVTSVLQSLV